MIQLLTGFAAKQLLQREAEHPQLAKIQALLKAYGTEYDFCRFYRQNLDENDTAYMCKLDDSGVLWVGEHSNIQEWTDFIGMAGLSEISVAGKNGFELQNNDTAYTCQSGNIFVKLSSRSPADIEKEKTTSLSQVFEVVSRCFPNLTQKQFDGWYCDISHRIRHGVCKAFLHRESAAAVVLSYGQTAIISQFCVLPEYRGHGVGSQLIKIIESVYSGQKLVVFSKDEASDDFYRKNDFLPAERWFTLHR